MPSDLRFSDLKIRARCEQGGDLAYQRRVGGDGAGDAVGGAGGHVHSLCGLWGCLRPALGVGHRDNTGAIATCRGQHHVSPLEQARGVIEVVRF